MSRPATVLRRLAPLVAAAALLAPATASAAPALAGEFDLGGTPRGLTLGPDGNVWVAEQDALPDNVVSVAPDGTPTPFAIPGVTNPQGIVTGPDGQLWMTASEGIVHFSPADPTAGQVIAVAGLSPQNIVSGPGGDLWTASQDTLYKIDPTADTATAITGTGLVGARGIAAGSDGKLYVADFGGAQIIAIAPTGGAGTKYPVTGGGPQEVAPGPAGQLGFTDPTHSPEQVGLVNIGTLTPPTFPFAVPPDPFGIVFANDGAYWIADFAADQLSRMTTAGAVTSPVKLTAGAGPRSIAKGAGDTLWVGEEQAKKIARVTGVSAPVVTPPPITPPPVTPPPTTPPGGKKDTTPPTVSKLSLSAHVRKGTAPKLKVTLSEAAELSFRVDRKAAGRRKGRRCVAPTRKLRKAKAKHCTRVVKVKTFTHAAGKGANAFSLHRIARLAPGSYRVTIVATDTAKNAARKRTEALKVLKRKPKRHKHKAA